MTTKNLIVSGDFESPYAIDLPDDLLRMLADGIMFTMTASISYEPPASRNPKKEVVSVHLRPIPMHIIEDEETWEKTLASNPSMGRAIDPGEYRRRYIDEVHTPKSEVEKLKELFNG